MAAIPLFWNTNMAAVTSCENALYAAREFRAFRFLNSCLAYIINCVYTLNKLLSEWRHFSLAPTLWGPVGQLWTYNGRTWNPKLTINVNSLWIKIKAQNFARQVSSKHTFKIWRKIGSDFLIIVPLKDPIRYLEKYMNFAFIWHSRDSASLGRLLFTNYMHTTSK